MTASELAERERLEDRVDEIEGEVAKLQDELETVTNRGVPLLKGTMRRVVGSDVASIDELLDAGQAVSCRLDAIEDRLVAVEARLDALGDVGTEKTSKAEKFAAVLAFAVNKRNGAGTVAMSPHEVKGCTGVSRRYAYELIDAMGAEVAGVEVREATRVRTGSGTKRKGKALLVDCERVHSGRGVNEVTTGGEGKSK